MLALHIIILVADILTLCKHIKRNNLQIDNNPQNQETFLSLPSGSTI